MFFPGRAERNMKKGRSFRAGPSFDLPRRVARGGLFLAVLVFLGLALLVGAGQCGAEDVA